MELNRISKYVDDLLELSAVRGSDAQSNVYVALRHLLTAVSIFETMTPEEREDLARLKKKLQYFFSASFSLKERKRRKDKENIPPTPPIKEKEKKEKAEKTHTRVCDAKTAFHDECLTFVGQYDNQLLADFYYYWSEEDGNGKMRFQNEKWWSTERRLKKWCNNQFSKAVKVADIRLNRARRQQAKDAAAAQQQQQAADIRQQQDAQREQAMAECRQESMTTDEYVAANPDGLMARMAREREKRERGIPNS